jgi:aromatic-L-amino-acid decarboxylase
MPHPQSNRDRSLDPQDWAAYRAQGHRMLDDMLDYLEHIRERPVWQPMPGEVRARFRGELPVAPSELSAVHNEFMRDILPYSNGNVHPGFMGWVHGGGNAAGVLAEMLAAGLNANLGGRDHAPIEVERQIVQWMRELFGFPSTATGLFVAGTSMANLIAVLVARDAALGFEVRRTGVGASKKRLTAYASAAAHGSLRKAFDCSGLGSDALRLVPVDHRHQMNLAALKRMIESDLRAGDTPFLVAGTAGTVDIGAIDDLDGLAAVAQEERLWMHVDGAYGALGILTPEIAPHLAGIEAADSLAFDFHKWGQVPYEAGFVLVRDGELHRKAFASPAAYLERETRGLAGGSPWPCDFGPDMPRGFRALKTWFTLKVHGLYALGESIARTCELARYLEQRVAQIPELELLAPVQLNIVCFRYRCPDADRINARIVADLQESGVAAPSTTSINGSLAIRVAITNHRTSLSDIDALVEATLAVGRAMMPATVEDPELEAALRD